MSTPSTATVAGACGIERRLRLKTRLRSRARRFAISSSTFRRYGRAPATPLLRRWSAIFRFNSLTRLRAASASQRCPITLRIDYLTLSSGIVDCGSSATISAAS